MRQRTVQLDHQIVPPVDGRVTGIRMTRLHPQLRGVYPALEPETTMPVSLVPGWKGRSASPFAVAKRSSRAMRSHGRSSAKTRMSALTIPNTPKMAIATTTNAPAMTAIGVHLCAVCAANQQNDSHEKQHRQGAGQRGETCAERNAGWRRRRIEGGTKCTHLTPGERMLQNLRVESLGGGAHAAILLGQTPGETAIVATAAPAPAPVRVPARHPLFRASPS
jgi:hypothetical protein